MARTPEMDRPVRPEYQVLLRDLVEEVGRDKVAALAGIDPSTVHRNVNEGNLTYTTAMKLRDAIGKAFLEKFGRELKHLPPPFVGVVSQGHYDLCEIGAKLHDGDGERFGELMEHAVRLMGDSDRERILESAKRGIAHPIRKDTKRR